MVPQISPSDLTFLHDECPRCLHAKYVEKVRRPSTPMPSIFTRIDSAMKTYYRGRTLVSADGVRGRVVEGSDWVQSAPIELPHGTCTIKGRFDTVIAWEDDTYSVVDFKTAPVRPEYLGKYERQLAAYAYSLTHPA
jgi:hypothetical protein